MPSPDPPRGIDGPVLVTDYKNLTDTDIKTWLDLRGIKTGVQGRDRLFEVLAGEVSSVACKVGVTDSVKVV